jgi:transcriptional regulator with XRE-family HTH domain
MVEPNNRLRGAMLAARVTIEGITEATGVDPKTVHRWLNGRVPHARHRWAVATLLGEDEAELWPNSGRSRPSVGVRSEVVAAYGKRDDLPPSAWEDLLLGARSRIDMLGYALYFLTEQQPDLLELLASRPPGCQTRILLADPNCVQVRYRDAEAGAPGALAARIRSTLHFLHALGPRPAMEIRHHTAPAYNSVFRFDDHMLVTPHLHGTPGGESPLLHLRNLGPDGLFVSFLGHFESLWKVSVPVDASRFAPRFVPM